MPRIFSILVQCIQNVWTCIRDTSYILHKQLVGLFDRSDPRAFHTTTSKGTVILLPGIYERWYIMKPVADAVYKQGYDVHFIETLGFGVGSIEAMARTVHEYITSMGITSCVIVAHSKGGLVAKSALLQYNQTGIIAGVIALNTPFSGSPYAYIMPFRHLRIFMPSSQALRILGSNTAINKYIVSIYGQFDPQIPRGSFLRGARNIKLNCTGHYQGISNQIVHRAVIQNVAGLFQKKSA